MQIGRVVTAVISLVRRRILSLTPDDRSLLILFESYDDVDVALSASVGVLDSHRESRRLQFKTMRRIAALRGDLPSLWPKSHLCAAMHFVGHL